MIAVSRLTAIRQNSSRHSWAGCRGPTRGVAGKQQGAGWAGSQSELCRDLRNITSACQAEPFWFWLGLLSVLSHVSGFPPNSPLFTFQNYPLSAYLEFFFLYF